MSDNSISQTSKEEGEDNGAITTLLIHAAYIGDSREVVNLLKNGDDCFSRDRHGWYLTLLIILLLIVIHLFFSMIFLQDGIALGFCKRIRRYNKRFSPQYRWREKATEIVESWWLSMWMDPITCKSCILSNLCTKAKTINPILSIRLLVFPGKWVVQHSFWGWARIKVNWVFWKKKLAIA